MGSSSSSMRSSDGSVTRDDDVQPVFRASDTERFGRADFKQLWTYYAGGKRDAALRHDVALKFLRDFFAVLRVEYNDDFGKKLIKEVAKNQEGYIEYEEFKSAFRKATRTKNVKLTQSLISSLGGDEDVWGNSDDDDGDGDGDGSDAGGGGAAGGGGDDKKKRRRRRHKKGAADGDDVDGDDGDDGDGDGDDDDAESSSASAPRKPTNSDPQPPSTASPPSPPTSSDGGHWHYYDSNEQKWTPYDKLTQRLIEHSSSSGQRYCMLNHGEHMKVGGRRVDFCVLWDSERKSGKSHHIARVPPPDKSTRAGAHYGSGEGGRTELKKSADMARVASTAGSKTAAACKKLCKWRVLNKDDDDHDGDEEMCPVCMDSLWDLDDDDQAVRLGECDGHAFHAQCIVSCFKEKDNYLQCPICGVIYGTRYGQMPKGTFTNSKGSSSLPGHPGCGTITLRYNFPGGTQGPEHPSPGTAYSGTSRTAYLPDNAAGNEVLELLKIGFERRLLFQVGTSVTNGTSNTVVWAGVHHKTSTSGGATGYGYPDDTYLSRVSLELAAKGVTVADIPEATRKKIIAMKGGGDTACARLGKSGGKSGNGGGAASLLSLPSSSPSSSPSSKKSPRSRFSRKK